MDVSRPRGNTWPRNVTMPMLGEPHSRHGFHGTFFGISAERHASGYLTQFSIIHPLNPANHIDEKPRGLRIDPDWWILKDLWLIQIDANSPRSFHMETAGNRELGAFRCIEK